MKIKPARPYVSEIHGHCHEGGLHSGIGYVAVVCRLTVPHRTDLLTLLTQESSRLLWALANSRKGQSLGESPGRQHARR